jgi:hypothetical protein
VICHCQALQTPACRRPRPTLQQSLPFSLFRNINNIHYTAFLALGSYAIRRNSYHLSTGTCVCVGHPLDANWTSRFRRNLPITTLQTACISIWAPSRVAIVRQVVLA